jgi:hypothetical protein
MGGEMLIKTEDGGAQLEICFAPTMIQNLAFSLIFCSTVKFVNSVKLKHFFTFKSPSILR